MTVRQLLKSCATPPASRSSASMRRARATGVSVQLSRSDSVPGSDATRNTSGATMGGLSERSDADNQHHYCDLYLFAASEVVRSREIRAPLHAALCSVKHRRWPNELGAPQTRCYDFRIEFGAGMSDELDIRRTGMDGKLRAQN